MGNIFSSFNFSIDISDIKDFFIGAVVIITLDQIDSDLAGRIFEYLKLIVLYIGGIGLFCSLLFCMPIFNIIYSFPFNLLMIIVISKIKEIINTTIKDNVQIIPYRISNFMNPIFNYLPLGTINDIFKFPYDMIDKFMPSEVIDMISSIISSSLDKGKNIPILSSIIDLFKFIFGIIKILIFEPISLQNEDIILYILIGIAGII
jgi:hypothetical protein